MMRNWQSCRRHVDILPHPRPCVDVRHARRFKWGEKSFFDRGVVHAKSQNVPWACRREHPEKGLPLAKNGTTLLCKGRGAGDPRCFHASPRLFQLLKDHSRAKCTRQDESSVDVSRNLPLTANHGRRIRTLCTHQINGGRRSPGQHRRRCATQTGTKSDAPLPISPHILSRRSAPAGMFSTPEPILTRLAAKPPNAMDRCCGSGSSCLSVTSRGVGYECPNVQMSGHKPSFMGRSAMP